MLIKFDPTLVKFKGQGHRSTLTVTGGKRAQQLMEWRSEHRQQIVQKSRSECKTVNNWQQLCNSSGG